MSDKQIPSDNQTPFTPDNIHADVLKMAGKPDTVRKAMADKANYKFSQVSHSMSSLEFNEIYNEVALKSRIDSDKTQQVFCKTKDGKIHDQIKPDETISEIWIGDPQRDRLFNWGNYKVYSQEKEAEKEKKNQASLSQRGGMLRTLIDENKIE